MERQMANRTVDLGNNETKQIGVFELKLAPKAFEEAGVS